MNKCHTSSKIKILVVTHKNCKVPIDDMYQPIAVGSNKDMLESTFIRDDIGENIAQKNSQYSELTALYWAWKNLNYDYIGIVHYRRYMTKRKCKTFTDILSKEDALKYLKKYEILVTKPRKYLESVKNHYINCHKTQHKKCIKQIQILENVIKEYQPDYYKFYNSVLNSHSAHMFNMFVMNKKDLNEYCSWLFPILFETEIRIKKENVTYERLMGSLSEFLLDVWLIKNNKKVKNMNLYQTELNFFKRVQRFIYRRFFEKE